MGLSNIQTRVDGGETIKKRRNILGLIPGSGEGAQTGGGNVGVASGEVVHSGGQQQSLAAQWRRTIYHHEK